MIEREQNFIYFVHLAIRGLVSGPAMIIALSSIPSESPCVRMMISRMISVTQWEMYKMAKVINVLLCWLKIWLPSTLCLRAALLKAPSHIWQKEIGQKWSLLPVWITTYHVIQSSYRGLMFLEISVNIFAKFDKRSFKHRLFAPIRLRI